MKVRTLPLVVAMLAATRVVLPAQQPKRTMQPMRMQNPSAMSCAAHGMMMGSMMGGQMRGMGRGMMNDSSMMTQMRTELGLTDAQTKQMQSAHERACAAAQPEMQMAMQAQQAAMDMLHGEHPNLDAYKQQLEKASTHMIAAEMEMAKGMIAFHNTLTPAQRQKMNQLHQRMMRGG